MISTGVLSMILPPMELQLTSKIQQLHEQDHRPSPPARAAYSLKPKLVPLNLVPPP